MICDQHFFLFETNQYTGKLFWSYNILYGQQAAVCITCSVQLLCQLTPWQHWRLGRMVDCFWVMTAAGPEGTTDFIDSVYCVGQ